MTAKPNYVPGKDYSRKELLKLIVAQGWSVESKGKTGHLVCSLYSRIYNEGGFTPRAT